MIRRTSTTRPCSTSWAWADQRVGPSLRTRIRIDPTVRTGENTPLLIASQ